MIYFVIYAITVSILWGVGTALGFKLLDILTPMLPFGRFKRENPWIIVALLALAGVCIAYLLKAFQFAQLMRR